MAGCFNVPTHRCPSGSLSAPAKRRRHPTPEYARRVAPSRASRLSAETLESVAPASIARPACRCTRSFVPDSRSKLATAVTRARVDHPSFLCCSAPSQISSGCWLVRTAGIRCLATNLSKSGASLWYIDKKPRLAAAGVGPVDQSVLIPKANCHVVFFRH
jgi:hypothetical protein